MKKRYIEWGNAQQSPSPEVDEGLQSVSVTPAVPDTPAKLASSATAASALSATAPSVTPATQAASAASTEASPSVAYQLGRISGELFETLRMRRLSRQNKQTDSESWQTAVEEEPSETAPRALIMVHGKSARSVFRSVAEAGMCTIAPVMGDWRLDVNPKIAHETVRLDGKASRALLANAYAVLQAAHEAQVHVIFLGDDSLALADDNRFLIRAAQQGICVFKALSEDVSGTHWVECVADENAQASQPSDWRMCHKCKLTFDNGYFIEAGYCCPSCHTLARLGSKERIELCLDKNTFEEWDVTLDDSDPLQFSGYAEKIRNQREKTGLQEGVCTGCGRIGGMKVAVGFMDSAFFMGSMGYAVGEKISRLFDRAREEQLPVILFCASGGARMQEGLVSLMQMAKTSCAVERHAQAGLLYISVLTDPTTGGVTASFATLGDIILAEPHALIGFAGPRVIRDTIKQELPQGFQTAEFALEHGLIDAIVARAQMRDTLQVLLCLHTPQCTQEALTSAGVEVVQTNVNAAAYEGSRKALREKRKLERLAKRELKRSGATKHAEPGSAWESVQLARNVNRPTAMRYINEIFDSFVELHGDRSYADDAAIVAGLGFLNGQAVTVLAQEKGIDLKDRIRRNFGCPQPEGYRKTARLMRQAEKFGRPVVCLVDTQGAFCGTEAEERGQGNAIAENLQLMASLHVPVVSVLLGEGGSGGALAMALANKVAMQEHAVYSVLSPEGFASILWKDGSRAPEAAQIMRMNAHQVCEMGIVDAVLSEGEGAAHENPQAAIAEVKRYLCAALEELGELNPEELMKQRQERFAAF